MQNLRESVSKAVRKSLSALGGVATFIGQQISVPALPEGIKDLAYEEVSRDQEESNESPSKVSPNDTVVICPSVCEECATENQAKDKEESKVDPELEAYLDTSKDCLLVAVDPASKRMKVAKSEKDDIK